MEEVVFRHEWSLVPELDDKLISWEFHRDNGRVRELQLDFELFWFPTDQRPGEASRVDETIVHWALYQADFKSFSLDDCATFDICCSESGSVVLIHG